MTSPEHSNHFADMDKKDSNNNTLLQICEKSAANIDPEAPRQLGEPWEARLGY